MRHTVAPDKRQAVVIPEQLGPFVGAEVSKGAPAHPLPGLTQGQVLQTQDDGRSLPHQQGPAPQQVAYRPILTRIDVARGQNIESGQPRQEGRVRQIIGLLDPVVLIDGRRVGQNDGIPVIH